jgi:hypothetical protein
VDVPLFGFSHPIWLWNEAGAGWLAASFPEIANTSALDTAEFGAGLLTTAVIDETCSVVGESVACN